MINNTDNAFLSKMQYENNKFDNLNIKTSEDEALRKASNEFESFFLQQLLDISLKNTNVAGEGVGNDIIKGMYTEAIAKNTTGSFGISDMLYRFLSENKK